MRASFNKNVLNASAAGDNRLPRRCITYQRRISGNSATGRMTRRCNRSSISTASGESSPSPNPASTLRLIASLLRQEEPEQDERKQPGQVEVEPVCQRDLERDEHRSGERRELDGALPSRKDGDDKRQHDRGHDQDRLDEAEIRDPLGVVLPPAPE